MIDWIWITHNIYRTLYEAPQTPWFDVSIPICPLSGQESGAFRKPELNATIWFVNKAITGIQE